ncbi:hypothetical protein [Elizabethkingia meningoseptica]|uniref:hypothetical protein n=1 Tax=Elizabethkingia meningoseptica TaxID=238 RepID=UPI003158706F
MKIQELRIGNYLKYEMNQFHIIVESIELTNNLVNATDIEYLEPIPLTEERLLEFGFDSDLVLRSEGLELSYTPDPSNIEVSTKFELNGVNIPIEYVHQLQNLYFVLTGKDLKLK